MLFWVFFGIISFLISSCCLLQKIMEIVSVSVDVFATATTNVENRGRFSHEAKHFGNLWRFRRFRTDNRRPSRHVSSFVLACFFFFFSLF